MQQKPPLNFDHAWFCGHIAVPRETFLRLQQFHDLLLKWQSRINLISPKTVDAIWWRHIVDSAQLLQHIPDDTNTLLDIGTGGGFPGLILATMGATDSVILVESDQRKAAFLREALRITETQAELVVGRIEEQIGIKADVITARACAPLKTLLEWGTPHMKKNAFCLFLKGENCTKEIEEAIQSGWRFETERHTSLTNPHGVILKIRSVAKE